VFSTENATQKAAKKYFLFFSKLWDTHKKDSREKANMAITFSSKECDDFDMHTTWKMKKFT